MWMDRQRSKHMQGVFLYKNLHRRVEIDVRNILMDLQEHTFRKCHYLHRNHVKSVFTRPKKHKIHPKKAKGERRREGREKKEKRTYGFYTACFGDVSEREKVEKRQNSEKRPMSCEHLFENPVRYK